MVEWTMLLKTRSCRFAPGPLAVITGKSSCCLFIVALLSRTLLTPLDSGVVWSGQLREMAQPVRMDSSAAMPMATALAPSCMVTSTGFAWRMVSRNFWCWK